MIRWEPAIHDAHLFVAGRRLRLRLRLGRAFFGFFVDRGQGCLAGLSAPGSGLGPCILRYLLFWAGRRTWLRGRGRVFLGRLRLISSWTSCEVSAVWHRPDTRRHSWLCTRLRRGIFWTRVWAG